MPATPGRSLQCCSQHMDSERSGWADRADMKRDWCTASGVSAASKKRLVGWYQGPIWSCILFIGGLAKHKDPVEPPKSLEEPRAGLYGLHLCPLNTRAEHKEPRAGLHLCPLTSDLVKWVHPGSPTGHSSGANSQSEVVSLGAHKDACIWCLLGILCLNSS